ncbi:2220_t:CDS:1, partial [Funneliformis geosporum]
QLLAGNQKLTMNIMRQLRKPIARKINKGKGPEEAGPSGTTAPPNEGAMDTEEQDNGKPEDDDNYGENEPYSLSTPNKNDPKSTALNCQAHIKKKEISLIVDSGSCGCIISLKLLKELDMEIDKASKTIMVNVNGERRRPLGMVTK